jgi:hypothetical protein
LGLSSPLAICLHFSNKTFTLASHHKTAKIIQGHSEGLKALTVHFSETGLVMAGFIGFQGSTPLIQRPHPKGD